MPTAFVKGNVVGYAVMEKRTGWGAEYAADVRNGEWEYQAFNAQGQPNAQANIKACFECHKPKGSDDFVFSLAAIKAQAAK